MKNIVVFVALLLVGSSCGIDPFAENETLWMSDVVQTAGTFDDIVEVSLDDPGDEVVFRVRVVVGPDVEDSKARLDSEVVIFVTTKVVNDFSGYLMELPAVEESTGIEQSHPAVFRIDLAECVGGCERVYLVTRVWSADKGFERGLPLGVPLELEVYASAQYYLPQEVENPDALLEDLMVTVELVDPP